PVIVCVPVFTAVGLTSPLPSPFPSTTLFRSLKVPVPSLVQLTVPVGMFAPLPLVTVAVQAVALSTATEGGVQLTLVAVARRPTPAPKRTRLDSSHVSPSYAAVSLWMHVPTAV